MKKHLVFLLYVFTLFTLYVFAPNYNLVFAAPSSWHLSYPTNRVADFIKASKINPGVIYASIQTIEGGFDLLKTDNNGLNWTSIKGPLTQGHDINWISLSKDESLIAVSVWQSGIYLSKDKGITWIKVFNSSSPRSVEIHPLSQDILYVGVGGTNGDPSSGLYKTIDAGQTWNKIPAFGNKNSGQITITTNPLTVYAGGDPDFYKSIDDGVSWTLLPIHNVYSNILVDKDNPNELYASQYNSTPGIFKSIDQGTSWNIKSNGINSPAFRLVQNSNGVVLATRTNYGGGLWESADEGESWENIQDPFWNNRNTVGVDVQNNRIFVSVEGLGIYYADVQPSSSGPKPVVFIPGLAGSWSYKGLVENQPTSTSDWTLTPHFTDQFYQPLLATLRSAGLSDNTSLFVFGYDWRKSIATSALTLNTYLQSQVIPQNPGKKVNIIGHSMGGLVARYCFEKIAACSDKIDKIITGGSPHKGVIQAYKLWEGGEIEESNPVIRALEEVVLHTTGLPYVTNKDIIQNIMPGARDILPTFDYISGKPYSLMSLEAKNPVLESLASPSSSLATITTTFSGLNKITDRSYGVVTASPWESTLGMWKDGKPTTSQKELGDGTTLQLSSTLSGIVDFRFPVDHTNYFANASVLAKTLELLSLTGAPVTTSPTTTSFLLFLVRSPATIEVKDQNGNVVGTSAEGKAVFISNPASPQYSVILTGTGVGPYTVESYFSKGDNKVVTKSVNGVISLGQVKTETYTFSQTTTQRFHDPLAISYFTAFIDKLNKIPGSKSIAMKDKVTKLYNSISTAVNRKTTITQLEAEFPNLIKMFMDETNEQNKTVIGSSIATQISFLDALNNLYGTAPTLSAVSGNINRAQGHITRMQTKANPGVQKALNISFANNLFENAKLSLAANDLYIANLQAQGVTLLIGSY